MFHKHKKRRHRHFLALPVIAVLFTVSLLQGWSLLHASVVSPLSAEKSYLQSGKHLIQSQGVMKADAAGLTLTGVDGAFFTSVRGDTVTVAALTTPVLVSDGTDGVLVPAGLQWQGSKEDLQANGVFDAWLSLRTLKSLPLPFIREQFALLQKKQEGRENLEDLEESLFGVLDISLDLLQFPAARERSALQNSENLLTRLPSYVQSGDREGVEQSISTLQNDPSFFSALSNQNAVALLLQDASYDSVLLSHLLSPLAQQNDLWLVLHIHPVYRDAVWGLEMPQLSQQEQQIALLALPQADEAQEPMQDFLYERWVQDIVSFVRTTEEPDLFLGTLFNLLVPIVEQHAHGDHPLRAQLLSQALLSLSEQTHTSLTEKQRSILFHPTDQRAETESRETDKKEELDADVTFTPDEVEKQAYQLLHANAALFTVDTRIEAKSPTVARVSRIVISGGTKDHMVDFLLNVATEQAGSIVIDGEKLPHALSLSDFAEWVREQ